MQKRMRLHWMVAIIALVALSAIACGGADDAEADGSHDGVTGTVVVLAASSLTDAFSQIESEFESAHPGSDVQLDLGGSSALREQILGGAPADVFASASEATMAQVVDAAETAGEPLIFARNLLQIAVPLGNPAEVIGLADFSNPDLLLGLCAEGVPCGDLAREALAGVGVEPAVDTDEADVRALLTKIAAGELDAGIVYVTDVLGAKDTVEGIEIPDDQNVEAVYPIVRLTGSPNPRGADAFIQFVLSDAGRSVLAAHGFTAP